MGNEDKHSPGRIRRLAHELWSHFNLCVIGVARQSFENAPFQEGFEAWRKVLRLVRSRSEVRRLEFSSKIQKPTPAAKIFEIPAALERWDTHMREYVESGGRQPSYDERRSALMHLLPVEIRRDVLVTLHVTEPPPNASAQEQDAAYMQLRSMLQKRTELIAQYEALHPSRGPNINNVGNGDASDPASKPDEEFPQPQSDDVVGNTFYAVYQTGFRKGKGGGKGKAGSPSAKGPGKGTSRCLNCGKPNHRTEDCRLPRVPAWERPCFNCGKPGHQDKSMLRKENKRQREQRG